MFLGAGVVFPHFHLFGLGAGVLLGHVKIAGISRAFEFNQDRGGFSHRVSPRRNIRWAIS